MEISREVLLIVRKSCYVMFWTSVVWAIFDAVVLYYAKPTRYLLFSACLDMFNVFLTSWLVNWCDKKLEDE